MTTVRAAMPKTEAAMRGHMEADPPEGHGMDAAEMPMAAMQKKHDAMHADGAPHTHAGMNALPVGREFRVAVDAWPLADLEIRAEGDGMTFRGYAAVFDSWSEDLGGFREQIAPGAFARTLKRDRNLRMFLNHNSDHLLATTKANTLTLTEDDKGLLAEASLPNTTLGRDTAELLRRGDIDSMSFGFQVDSTSEAHQQWSADGTERVLKQIRLFEVSPVTGWPAYSATSASVRELAEGIDADVDELAAAFAVLKSPDTKLTDEQHRLLVAAVNSRYDTPVRRAFSPEEDAIYRRFTAALTT